MPIPELPQGWPLFAADRLAEDQVRQFFAYLRTGTLPVMAEGE